MTGARRDRASSISSRRTLPATGRWSCASDGLASGAYELWLTRGREARRALRRLRGLGRETTVPLNAPYRLRQFDGWVVVAVGSEKPVLTT